MTRRVCSPACGVKLCRPPCRSLGTVTTQGIGHWLGTPRYSLAVRTLAAVSRILGRYAIPFTGAIALLGAFMGLSLWILPELHHLHGWSYNMDFWNYLQLAHLADIGAYQVIYGQTTIMTTPGIVVVLAPVWWVIHAAGMSVTYIFPLWHPTAWLVLAPYEVLLSASVLFAVDAVAVRLGASTRRRSLICAIEVYAALQRPPLGPSRGRGCGGPAALWMSCGFGEAMVEIRVAHGSGCRIPACGPARTASATSGRFLEESAGRHCADGGTDSVTSCHAAGDELVNDCARVPRPANVSIAQSADALASPGFHTRSLRVHRLGGGAGGSGRSLSVDGHLLVAHSRHRPPPGRTAARSAPSGRGSHLVFMVRVRDRDRSVLRLADHRGRGDKPEHGKPSEVRHHACPRHRR